MKIRWILGLLIIYALFVINIGELAAEKTWTQRADMPTARYNFDTCIVDGKVFTIGGQIDAFGDKAMATVEVYDPKTDTWERKADMPTARFGMATLVVGGKIYVIGGDFRGNGPYMHLSTVEIYDPETDRWTQEPDMLIGKSGHKAEVINGEIYVFGGSTAGVWAPLADVEVYGTGEVPRSVDPVGKLVKTWGAIKTIK